MSNRLTVNCLAIFIATFGLLPTVFAESSDTSTFQFSSEGLSALHLRLPTAFSDSTKIVFAGGENLPAGLAMYCLPNDAALTASHMRGQKLDIAAEVGCVTVSRARPVSPDGDQSFNLANGRFGAQEYAERLAKAIPSRHSPRSRVLGADRKEVRGVPVFTFTEEWSGPAAVVVVHHLYLFDGKDVWELIFAPGSNIEKASSLWVSVMSGL